MKLAQMIAWLNNYGFTNMKGEPLTTGDVRTVGASIRYYESIEDLYVIDEARFPPRDTYGIDPLSIRLLPMREYHGKFFRLHCGYNYMGHPLGPSVRVRPVNDGDSVIVP